MSTPTARLPPTEDDASANTAETDIDHAPKNHVLLVLYQVVIRTGWIFKTESIIMPAVLDAIAGQGWIRGCLPMLNRFGQSIPPVLASQRVRSAAFKKHSLALTTAIMGATFWALACLWLVAGEKGTWWLPGAFLTLYAVFFVSTGINNLIVGTVTGKFILPDRRGRLMLLSNTIGVLSAVGCAWLLLRNWLSETEGNFFAIFAFTGTCFLLGAAVCLLFKERPDSHGNDFQGVRHLFQVALRTLAHDRKFRRLAMVASLFGMSTTLFPHYQALGRQRLELGLDNLLPWVIAQNIGVFLISVPAGSIADRCGNRIVLRSLLLVLCAVPLLALGLSRSGNFGASWYFLVFCGVGITPVIIRLLQHYCLELVPRQQQPQYLSTLNLAMAGPAILTSALLGALLDVLGFEAIFLSIGACLVLGWMLSALLVEPRDISPAQAAALEAADLDSGNVPSD